MQIRRFILSILLAITLQMTNVSCRCINPKIVHIDFCDFLNNFYQKFDEIDSPRVFQEKSLHYFVDESNSKCLEDTVFRNYIRRNPFIQKEIHNGYYRLTVTFYKKSELTEALMKLKSSKYLDYSNDDIIVEYQWIEGKISEPPLFFENGIIKGAENIQLDSNSVK